MRKIDESRAANYIRKHSNYKKWLAFVLCLSLLTGTITLYILNKPATAMTEEGAKSVGLILETADAEEEAELIQQTIENKAEAEKETEPVDAIVEEKKEVSEVDVTDGEETKKLTNSTESIEEEPEDGEKLIEQEELSREEKIASLNIPDSVNLNDYVTETIIERYDPEGDSWEEILKDDINPGDQLRITVNYVLPKEATVSDDIHYEVPDEFGTANAMESSLENGDVNIKVNEDNQISIQYSDEIKDEIIEEALNENLQASSTMGETVKSFLGLFSLTVYAEENNTTTNGSFTYYTTVANDGTTAKELKLTNDMITNIVMRKNATDRWEDGKIVAYTGGEDIQSGTQVSNGEELLFVMSFNIPAGALDGTNTVTYSLSERDINVSSNAVVAVYRNSEPYDRIGTCYVDTDGTVKIVFFDNIVSGNATENVTGDFYFKSKVNASGNAEEEPITYRFDDKFTLEVRVKNPDYYNHSLYKKATLAQDDNGNYVITYELTISSSDNGGGSGGDITLTDIMSITNEDSAVSSSISSNDIEVTSVKKYSSSDTVGNDMSVSANMTSAGFGMTLPELKAGEKYIITYTYEVPDSVASSNYDSIINNHAETSSTKSGNKEANIGTPIEGTNTKSIPKIRKSVTDVDPDTNYVEWTIVLNENNADLKGYTLIDMIRSQVGSDLFEYTFFDGTATITPDLNGKSTINLSEDGLTFTQSDTNTYKIVYHYTYDEYSLVWGTHVSNRAIIKSDDEHKSDTGDVNVWVENVNKDKIEKNNSGYYVESNNAIITWNIKLKGPISLNAKDDSGNSCFVFTDEISNTNIITAEQISELKSNLDKLGLAYKVETGDVATLEDGTNGYSGFTIRFYTAIEDNSNPEFTYHTTGYLGDGTERIDYTNTAYLFNKTLSGTSTVTHEPILSKYDGNMVHDKTTFSYYDDTLFNDGVLTWIIAVDIPSGADWGSMTLTESIPTDVTILDELENYSIYTDKGAYAVEVSTSPDMSNSEVVADNSSVSLASFSRNGNVFTFDSTSVKGSTLYVRIRARINDEFWEDGAVTTGEFTNSVKLTKTSDSSKSYGEDSQTQVVNKIETVIDKDSVYLNENQEMEYTIDINPDAENLLTDSNTLTMRDSLEATFGYAEIIASLLQDSIKVYDADTGVALSSDEYKYSIDSYNEKDGNGYHVYSVIEFIIPDERHIKIQYTYVFGCDDEEKYGWGKVKVSNMATLEGVSAKSTSSETNDEFEFEKIGVHAGLGGFEFYKVDSENTAVKLAGAKFTLYKYNTTTKDYDITINSFDTGSDSDEDKGHYSFSELDKNTGYKLIEDEAPSGYKKNTSPLYFLIENTSLTSYSIPGTLDDFKKSGGVVLSAGSDYFYKNVKDNASVTIEKIWVNADNTKSDFIDVKIGRRLGAVATGNEGNYWTVHFINRDAQNNITKYVGYPSAKDGSELIVVLDGFCDAYNAYLPTVVVNGESQPPSSNIEKTGWQRITYKIKINCDTTVEVAQPNQPYNYDPVVSISQPQLSTISTLDDNRQNDDFIEARITAAEGWSKTIESYVDADGKEQPLPRYEVVNGVKYQWIYYVSEYSNYYYKATYQNNNVNSGTITIINTRDEEKQSYTLPKTGGTGRMPYVAGGISVMSFALTGLVFVVNRKKRQKNSNKLV